MTRDDHRPRHARLLWAGAGLVALLFSPAAGGVARAHVRDASAPIAACASTPSPAPWPRGFLAFETPQCNPIARSRRGRLYVTDTPRHRILELTRSGRVRRTLSVGLEPAGVAASPDGELLYVTNHLSDSISVVDVRAWQVVATIQEIDPVSRLSRLDEPCGVAFSPTEQRAFVTLSRPNRLAVLDTTSHRVEKILDIGGEDPRALAVSSDGTQVFVAAFESGNRTEVEVPLEEETYQNGPFWWYAFLQLVVDTLVGSTGGEIATPSPGANVPPRPDDDVFVVDTSTWTVTPIATVGTLLYGLAADEDEPASVWVAATDHQNFLDGPDQLAGRPIRNRLSRLTRNGSGWADPDRAVLDLDEDDGATVPGGAIPSSVARTTSGETLVTAAASDRLVIVDASFGVRARVAVGSIPRGVVTRGNRAWVYNRGDSTVSIVRLDRAEEIGRVALGTDPLPADVVAGRRHFHAARFSANGTFACASCHPDAHVDQLVWNLGDGNRGTQTVRGLADTAPYHWDGSQADAATLIAGGVTGPVFQGSITPCEVAEMARFIENVSFPPSPFRPPTDLMSPEARFGAALVRRGIWLDENDDAVLPVQFDPGFEEAIVATGGETIAPSEGEACAASGCHVAPLWTSGGTAPPPFRQAVSFRGMWDRNAWLHDGTASKVANLEAANGYREFLGHPPSFVGVSDAAAASAAFFTTFFRGHEFDGAPDPIVFHPDIEAFLRELGTGLPGVLGRQVSFDGSPTADEARSLVEITNAAMAGKVTMRIRGVAAGRPVAWAWQPATASFLTEAGDVLSQAEATTLLSSGPVRLLVTADLPPNTATRPLLKTVVVVGESLLAEARNGETQTFEFRGSNFRPGSWLLVDGVPYAPLEVLDANTARHTENPVNAPGSFYVLSVLNPDGLASNEFPIPVTGAPAGPGDSFTPSPAPDDDPLG